jgi:hypothetical protein
MNFRIFFAYFLISIFYVSCTSDNSRCGDIIDKQNVSGKYYFILNADSNIFNTNGSEIESYVPDNSVSGEVTESVYNSFSVGEEYCAE